MEGERQSGATGDSAPTSPRTDGITRRSDQSRSLGVLSVPPSSWEQALANAHPRQHGDLCISVGIAGTACLCCWNRKESALEPAQSTHRESRSSSGHPRAERGADCGRVPAGARTRYPELTGLSAQPQNHPLDPNSKQNQGPVLFSPLADFLLCSEVFSQGNRTLHARRAGFHWQSRAAEMCGKGRIWGWELGVGGWHASFHEG